MATLRDPDGQIIALRAHHLVGRSRSMHTRLDHPSVSTQHASLEWTRDGWAVRDLGSRNGTRVGGALLTPGVLHPLSVGAVLELGSSSMQLTLLSADPPTASARSGGQLVLGSEGMLALPSLDEPLAVLLFDAETGWVLSEGAGSRAVLDGETIEVAGASWVLSLPIGTEATREEPTTAPSRVELALTLRLSADEEYLEVTAHLRGQAYALEPRAHQQLLLVLARARLADREREVGSAEEGWLYGEDLPRMLSWTPNQLYVNLHRVRKDFVALGLVDSADIIERRATTRQFRLGVARAEVKRL